jgi:hypothetical protein
LFCLRFFLLQDEINWASSGTASTLEYIFNSTLAAKYRDAKARWLLRFATRERKERERERKGEQTRWGRKRCGVSKTGRRRALFVFVCRW